MITINVFLNHGEALDRACILLTFHSESIVKHCSVDICTVHVKFIHNNYSILHRINRSNNSCLLSTLNIIISNIPFWMLLWVFIYYTILIKNPLIHSENRVTEKDIIVYYRGHYYSLY